MSTVGLESIDHTVQLTHIWTYDLDARLGWEDKQRSFRLLWAVLQTLRGWLPVNQAAGFRSTAARAAARKSITSTGGRR